jgi:hypothetical protein
MTEMQTFSRTLQATMADVGNDLKNWGLIRRWRSARGKVEKKSRQIINNENCAPQTGGDKSDSAGTQPRWCDCLVGGEKQSTSKSRSLTIIDLLQSGDRNPTG